MMYPRRGFALLVSIVLTSVVLAVGVALLDIAYKQVLLASSSKNSQYAFYDADGGLECALYWDQKFNSFDYFSPLPPNSIVCDTREVVNWTFTSPSPNLHKTTFDLTCASGGISSSVTVYKDINATTDIYANGYSTCDSTNPGRIERGLKAHY